MSPSDENGSAKHKISPDNSKPPRLDNWTTAISFLSGFKTIITIIVATAGGLFWLSDFIDDRVGSHTNTISSTLDTVSEALTSQIVEVKKDIRHLDKTTRDADTELRKNIKEMSEDIAQVKGDVRRLSDAAAGRTATENARRVGVPTPHPAVQEWENRWTTTLPTAHEKR